jgi:hypothetical protein
MKLEFFKNICLIYKMDNSQMVFANVLQEIIGVHDQLSHDEECDYCGGGGIIYIDDDEWEECEFCCESSDSDSDYEPESTDTESDDSYDSDDSDDLDSTIELVYSRSN